MKMSTCLYILVSDERGRHEFVNFTNHYMVSNKLVVNGLSNFQQLSNKPSINNPKLIIHYSSDPKVVNSLLFLFM